MIHFNINSLYIYYLNDFKSFKIGCYTKYCLIVLFIYYIFLFITNSPVKIEKKTSLSIRSISSQENLR